MATVCNLAILMQDESDDVYVLLHCLLRWSGQLVFLLPVLQFWLMLTDSRLGQMGNQFYGCLYKIQDHIASPQPEVFACVGLW